MKFNLLNQQRLISIIVGGFLLLNISGCNKKTAVFENDDLNRPKNDITTDSNVPSLNEPLPIFLTEEQNSQIEWRETVRDNGCCKYLEVHVIIPALSTEKIIYEYPFERCDKCSGREELEQAEYNKVNRKQYKYPNHKNTY